MSLYEILLKKIGDKTSPMLQNENRLKNILLKTNFSLSYKKHFVNILKKTIKKAVICLYSPNFLAFIFSDKIFPALNLTTFLPSTFILSLV